MNNRRPNNKPAPKPQPKPGVKPVSQVSNRKTRPQPTVVHYDPWINPIARPKPVRRRQPQYIIPVITQKRSSVHLNPGESLYYEGKATVDTNLLFDSCEGYFYVTSERIIMDSTRNAFNVYISDIRNCRKITGGLELTIISRTYRIYTYDATSIKKLIDELMYQYNEEDVAVDYALNNSYVAPVQTVVQPQIVQNTTVESNIDPYEEIKKLKELLDMGIISQAEFNAKKHQLLGI